ncbi:MAG: hypothetical protein ACOX75_01360 [Lachnospiraceae bacterium]|jgi:uncharacterized protein Smg (DUF494 family)
MSEKEKDLKRLSRKELVEIIYQYQQSDKELRAENDALKSELEDRRIKIENAGSIADAAMELNNVFGASQGAADMYMEEMRRAMEEAGFQSKEIIDGAVKLANSLKERTRRECDEMKKSTKEECARMKKVTRDYMLSFEAVRLLMEDMEDEA